MQNQPLECQVLSVGCGTLIFNRCARRTTTRYFSLSCLSEDKRDPTIRSQECAHFFTWKGLSLVALLQQMADISVQSALVLWIGWLRFMTPVVLQKRVGDWFLMLTLPFHQRGHTERLSKGQVSPSPQMKLQLSSPSKQWIMTAELCLASTARVQVPKDTLSKPWRVRTSWDDLRATTKSMGFTGPSIISDNILHDKRLNLSKTGYPTKQPKKKRLSKRQFGVSH